MTGIVGIYNMALAYIGQSETVADLTERSKAQRTCTMFYESCRDQMLSDFDWPFATTQVYLADIGSPVDPWLYRYAYPSDCLKVQEILEPGLQQAMVADSRIQYQLGSGATGTVINTNQAQALMRYTLRLTNTELFSALAVDALALLLASKIAMPMTVKSDLVGTTLQLYSDALGRARVHAFEQAQEAPEPQPEFIRARN